MLILPKRLSKESSILRREDYNAEQESKNIAGASVDELHGRMYSLEVGCGMLVRVTISLMLCVLTRPFK